MYNSFIHSLCDDISKAAPGNKSQNKCPKKSQTLSLLTRFLRVLKEAIE